MTKLIKVLVLLFLFEAFVVELKAAPAFPVKITKVGIDGTPVTVTLRGDEYCSYYLSEDGKYYMENTGGRLREITPDSIMARKALLTSNDESRRAERLVRKRKGKLGEMGNYIGDFKGLVLLVEFPNLKMSDEYPAMEFHRMFNSRGYSDYGAIGSVSDYFRDQSYGKFNLTFDVVGPFMMSKNYEYYGGNDPKTDNDRHAREMVIEACKQADSLVDFRDYDWDGDGELDQVFIIYAGYAESSGAPSNTIWPHESTVVDYELELDEIKIGTYGCASELGGRKGTIRAGIGTAVHEFSHCLGFPDVYDTDYSGAFGMGYWDVMNSGSHSGPTGIGEVPYGFGAYERWTAGWLEPTEIANSTSGLTLKDIGDSPEAYVIYNDGNRNEFYVIENHRGDRWFSFVGKQTGLHGMMVTHINYDAKAWRTNRVNPSVQNQRWSIIPADNEHSENEGSYAADLFPGPGGVSSLTVNSHLTTGGRMYNPNVDGSYSIRKNIINIRETDMGEILFDVLFEDDMKTPGGIEITEIDYRGYTVSWIPTEGARYYTVEQTSYDPSSSFPKPKTRKTEGLTLPTVRMEWLYGPTAKTRVRVRTEYDGISSEWSDYITLSGGEDPSAVMETSGNEEYIKIYTADGLEVPSLRKGLNIVRTRNGIKKIIK